MIEFDNIDKTFGEKHVLKNVSGKFTPGICNLIIGASGTGKSVLLKCLVGLIKVDQGSIRYNGREFTKGDNQTKQDIRREIGMLFQGSALFDSKTVEENVMFPLEMLSDMPLDEKKDRVNYCLQRVGLENVNKLMPSQISGGMQKRVGIARAIVMNSKYLYCDEPNSGLDPQTAIRIDTLIRDITQEFNITTVVVTHDMNSVLEIGDHVMFMYQGEKVWQGTKDDILNNKIKSLQDFLFSNKLIREAKANH